MSDRSEFPTGWDDIHIAYVNRLIKELGIKVFFESGTNKGQTSLYFNKQGLKVYTVEIDKPKFETNLRTFSGTNITYYNMPSKIAIKQYLKDEYPDTLFYLDAHECGGLLTGYGIPLRDELDILLNLPKFLIMIDNIGVPNQPQFGLLPNVQNEFAKVKIPRGTILIYPKYHLEGYVPATWHQHEPSSTSGSTHRSSRTVWGYCILSRSYPIIKDDNFSFTDIQ